MSNIIFTTSFNPYQNLGLEEYLLNNYFATPLLYLWQNKKTVVIGKCQNAYEECNLKTMKQLGVKLARRITGGGTVYHDIGNLNFSFILPPKIYDITRQLSVIINAFNPIGISATLSGRNDLICCDKKFSGNAFYQTKDACLHHGTILINENKNIIEQVLNVNKSKLESHGVKSVKSRICNLSEIVPELTVDKVKELLVDSFQLEYGKAEILSISPDFYKTNIKKFMDYDWIYGKNPTYNIKASGKTTYGMIDMFLNIKNQQIFNIKVYSDSLNENISEIIENALIGSKYSIEDIELALSVTVLNPAEFLSIIISSSTIPL